MKKYAVAFLLFFIALQSFAQGGPPPIGCDVFYVNDNNNDGYALFDINFYLNYLRIKALTEQNYDLSGYLIQFYPSETDLNNGSNEIGEAYTNSIINRQFCYLKFTYLGAGIEYNQQELIISFSCVVIEAVPYNGDMDSDGVLNYLEDLNQNTILNDEDTDNDRNINARDNDDDGDLILTIDEDYNQNGDYFDDDSNNNQIPDFLDPEAVLSIAKSTKLNFSIVPNPSTNSLSINFKNTFVSKFDILIYNTEGKIFFEKQNASKTSNISNLKSGLYLVKINSDNETFTQKLIVN